MIFILMIILILLIIFIGYYYISFIKSLYTTKVPYVGSFNRQLKILENLDFLKKGEKIVDLGCGDGKALRFFEKKFQLNGTGYDINSFAIFYGKIINKIKKSNIQLIKQDFRKIDNLKDFQYIYLYLFPEFMEEIEDWIFKNKGKDSIIISNSFKFKNHKPYKIIGEKILLYR